MKFQGLFNVILFSLFSIIALLAQDSDYSYSKVIKFVIEESNSGKFSLQSDLKVENKYLSERSTGYSKYFEATHFFNPIDDFTWSFRDEKYKKDDVNFFIPQFEDVFISNSKVYYFTIPENIKKGDKVDYEFTQKYRDISYFPVVKIPNIDYLENFKIIVEHPDYIKPEFSVFFPQKKFQYRIDSSKSNYTIFETGPLRENKELSYFPYNNIAAFVFVAIKNGNKNINPTNSKEFTKWYEKIVSLKPSLTADNKNILHEKLMQANSDFGRLKIIYDYVRKNFRYIAEEQDVNSFIPRDPSEVLKRGYADCKERAYLISAIARENGIKVNMALVPSDDAPETDQIFLTKFNHVICAYDTGRGTMFFDPTSKYCEFGNIPESDVGKNVLILDPGNPRTLIINPPNQNPFVEVEIDANVDSLKKAKAKVILRNDYFSAALHAEEELTGAKLENFLSTLITSSLYKISLEYFKPVKKEYNSLIFSADADLSHYIISSSSKKYIPKTPFLFYDNNILSRKDDNFNIYLDSRKKSILRIRLHAPGYSLSGENLSIVGKGSEEMFTAKASIEDSSIINLQYEIKQSLKKYNSETKYTFLNFCEEYLNNKTNMYILGENK